MTRQAFQGGVTSQSLHLVCFNKHFQGQGQVPVQILDAKVSSHAHPHRSPEARIILYTYGAVFEHMAQDSGRFGRPHIPEMCHIKRARQVRR